MTSKERPLTRLRAYDPTRLTGPIYHDHQTDTWHRNGNFTGELLLDGDLSLEGCSRVKFVDHHRSICKRNGCEYLGKTGTVAGARLLAMLMGNGVPGAGKLFVGRGKARGEPHDDTLEALRHLLTRVLAHSRSRGAIRAGDAAAPHVVTAILAGAGRGGRSGTRRLCDLFVDGDELRAAVRKEVRRYFSLRTAQQLENLAPTRSTARGQGRP